MIEYLPKSSEQLLTIVYSAGIGFALGFIYEILRLIFYLLSGSDKKFTLLRDIIFLLFVFTEKIKKKEKNIAKGKKNSENDLHNQYEIVYNQSVTVRPLSDETENRGD